jgi:L-cysteine/cystine lyase
MLPVTERCVYLNTGSLGPVSRIFADTLAACTLEDVEHGRAIDSRYERLDAARASLRAEIAAVAGAAPRDIVLTQSTRGGLSLVFEGLPWRHGDEIVVTDLEHPSCLAALAGPVEEYGLSLRVAQVPAESADRTDWLTDMFTPRTRLVAFSGVAFTTGRRLPIESIAAAARQQGAYTLLDAAQCAGAIPLDLGAYAIDFCALPLQKWLLGPEGLGALYVRHELASLLEATDRTVHGLGIYEAAAAELKWLRETVGWPTVFERTAALAAEARGLLAADEGLELLTPEPAAGLVTFSPRHVASSALAGALRARAFVLRDLPALDALRLSTAFFNTINELYEFIQAVSDSCRRL